MPKRSLPAMTIPFVRGTTPPAFCPRCAQGSRFKEALPPRPRTGPAWGPVPEATRERFGKMGFRLLARCNGCMWDLVEIEPEEVDR